MSNVLGGLPVARFLKEFWQKEPRVVRGAFPKLRDPLSPDELAGLACEPEVDSRLVIERGRKPWRVVQGPQDPKALMNLPPSHWTLLVESVDRHSSEVAAFARAFAFLPRWRMDDVMVSLAPIHGTVDAHIDSYDVFLIQGQGRRRWEVDRRSRPVYKPGLDLRILKHFHAEESWELEPGDMLYVPPGVGHRGITVQSDAGIALTYSVGFRAPSTADLLSTLLSHAIASEGPAVFADPRRSPARDAGEISRTDVSALRRFLIADIEGQTSDAWAVAMGAAVTSGGAGDGPTRVVGSALAKRFAHGATVTPVQAARMVWASLERGRAAIFVNGECRVLPREQAFAAPFVCGNGSRAGARRLALHPALVSLAADLFRAGVIRWRD